MGKQILWMVGVGLFFVLGFFFVSQWSAQYEWGEEGGSSDPSAQAEATGGTNSSTASGQGPGAEMPAASGGRQPETDLSTLVEELGSDVEGPVADEIDSLRTELDEADSGEQNGLRAELVRMYIGAGAPGRAALLQRELANETGSVDDRRRAANLLYRWMRQVEQQGDRDRIAEVARHVATAYQAVVDEQPDDLDARTRMGEAYLLTNNPMKGIQAINAVLKDDSTFVPARFQKGLALLQINRLDEALQQFELVQTHADPEEPFYKQAERAIEVINEQRSGGGAGSSSSQ
jgi:thioredoxin-like negative regulator of GroEL